MPFCCIKRIAVWHLTKFVCFYFLIFKSDILCLRCWNAIWPQGFVYCTVLKRVWISTYWIIGYLKVWWQLFSLLDFVTVFWSTYWSRLSFDMQYLLSITCTVYPQGRKVISPMWTLSWWILFLVYLNSQVCITRTIILYISI